MSGRPLDPARWAKAEVPVLVIDGGASESFTHTGAVALAAVLTNGDRRTLETDPRRVGGRARPGAGRVPRGRALKRVNAGRIWRGGSLVSLATAMEFSLERGREVLERTPGALRAMLSGLADDWTAGDEGPETWSPWQAVGHLTHI